MRDFIEEHSTVSFLVKSIEYGKNYSLFPEKYKTILLSFPHKFVDNRPPEPVMFGNLFSGLTHGR